MDNYRMEEMKAKANKIGAEAVGADFTVRTSKTCTVSGTILEAGFGRFERTHRSIYVVFRVLMECGANKTPREFWVKTLPRG